MKNYPLCIIACYMLLMFAACQSEPKSAGEDAPARTFTPVTLTTISTGPLAEYTELSATSQYMLKSYVKANVAGYIQSVNTLPGKFVNAGQTLFVVKTKEAQSIGNAVNKLDPSFRFSGINNIKASAPGYVAQLSHQAGDYVQEGEQLAVINDASSFAFILNLPYELRPFVLNQKTMTLTLPDRTKLNGTISSVIPSVDPASQTQQVVIKVVSQSIIPENLIAKVRIIKTQRPETRFLPKAAVLSDEEQMTYWVMKVTDDSTAVKVPVKKGIETNEAVEILSPAFSVKDRIVLTGNYGLPDTAGIKITTAQEP